jgi:adenosylmethionine-8-amino-7-oxononanoate aminotransferase
MKMAIQYWHSKGKPTKQRFISLEKGYHGDTFGAMSVCDPVTGMHHLFADAMPRQLFAPSPACAFDEPFSESHMAAMESLLQKNCHEVAAVIVEPIVQGTGGMNFYAPQYLKRVRELCDHYGVLLIADEIATGLGRTGKLFACEWAGISPDLLCLGKTLTGGYLTLAATLCSSEVAETISQGEPGVFMHGPTFMGNALACSVASASLELLLNGNWQQDIARINQSLQAGLSPARDIRGVKDVRTLGAIGVVELEEPVVMAAITPLFVASGIWVRPFGKLVYLMPPYVTSDADLALLTSAVVTVLEQYLTE